MYSIEDIATGLNSMAIHLLRRLRRQDSKLNVGPARLSALSVLVFGGSCSLAELAGYEQVTSATMSRIVTGLQDSRLVSTRRSPDDARTLRIEATGKGRALMKRGSKARVAILTTELERLSEKELACLQEAITILKRIEGSRSQ
jgi:DNA-binding MarR family transcriptional regulator